RQLRSLRRRYWFGQPLVTSFAKLRRTQDWNDRFGTDPPVFGKPGYHQRTHGFPVASMNCRASRGAASLTICDGSHTIAGAVLVWSVILDNSVLLVCRLPARHAQRLLVLGVVARVNLIRARRTAKRARDHFRPTPESVIAEPGGFRFPVVPDISARQIHARPMALA